MTYLFRLIKSLIILPGLTVCSVHLSVAGPPKNTIRHALVLPAGEQETDIISTGDILTAHSAVQPLGDTYCTPDSKNEGVVCKGVDYPASVRLSHPGNTMIRVGSNKPHCHANLLSSQPDLLHDIRTILDDMGWPLDDDNGYMGSYPDGNIGYMGSHLNGIAQFTIPTNESPGLWRINCQDIGKTKQPDDDPAFTEQATIESPIDVKIHERPVTQQPKIHHCDHDQCIYSSIRKGNLTRHKRTHLDAGQRLKIHHCDQCNYSTDLKCDLNRHKSIHLPAGQRLKIHHCDHDQCNYSTDLKSNLTIHKSTHLPARWPTFRKRL